MKMLENFPEGINAVVIGASGGIGMALVERLAAEDNIRKIHAFSRGGNGIAHQKVTNACIDLTNEESIEKAAAVVAETINLVIIASGLLHDETVKPEKSLRDLNFDAFQKIFSVNAFGPALVAKHFTPLLAREGKSVFAAISAQVGSISENKLGGWYAYRASKTALNMLLKTAAIEVARRYKEAVVVGLHPNTVDTKLSKPFHAGVDHDIFTPKQAAEHLLAIIDTVTPSDTGRIFNWDGQEIAA